MKVTYNFYPKGKTKAVTMSYDDGQIYDRRLVEIFNKYGVKGTFHLCSSFLDKEGFVSKSELKQLYDTHEISLHTVNHPTFAFTPCESQINDIVDDRKSLEKLTGRIIKGLSYPMGSFDSKVITRLSSIGVLYSRTTLSTGTFKLPENFLAWHPTMHHSRGKCLGTIDRNVLMNKAEEFTNRPDWFHDMPLFYIWGHSYEFENDKTWDLIEGFCKYISSFDNIWFATNIDIYNYVTAMKNLRFSADCSLVYNPSAISVWIGVEDNPLEIKGGETITLKK